MSQRGQSWHVLVGLIISLAGAVGIWWSGQWMPASQQIILWLLFLVGVVVITGRYWAAFLGPLFFYDVLRTGRRNRHIPSRLLYGCLLFAVVCILYSNWFPVRWDRWESLFSPGALSLEQLSHFAESLFATFLAAQLTVIFLLTPIYVAGSIAEEKERRTLDYLLTTDLSDLEIILGILGSRLANLSLLLLTGLPILMLIQFLGGVDAGLILAGFVVTGATMISLGSLSMAVSTSVKSPTAAIFLTYGISVLVFACIACFPGFGNFWFNAATRPTDSRGISEVVLILGITVLVHAVIAIVCLVFAKSQLRPAYVYSLPYRHIPETLPLPQRVLDGRAAKRSPVSATISQEGCGPEEPPRRSFPEFVPPDGNTPWPSKREPVSDPPMLWKEFYRKRGNNSPLVAYWGLLGIAFLFVGLPWAASGSLDWLGSAGAWICCLILLPIPFGAAGSMTRERERQTLDTLLVTPLERREILYGKWLGSVLIIRWPLAVLAAVFGPLLLTGGIHWLAWPLLVTSWFVYAGFLASLGLFLSTVCSTTLRATLMTVLITLGLGLTPASISPSYSLSWAGRFLTQVQQFGLSPPRAMMALAFNGNEPKERLAEVQSALIGVLIYAVAALVLWELSVAWLRRTKGDPPASRKLVLPWFRRFQRARQETLPGYKSN